MRAYSAGSAFAIDSPLVRGGLTAIAWLQSLPSPFIVVATLAEAEGWARINCSCRPRVPLSDADARAELDKTSEVLFLIAG
ncbi:MAG: hypothetical protein ABUL62_27365 [Myxococcales bacterium]